ncbi:MAG: flavodoxin family protein [Candidatus Helarchaeota archaeon]
MKNLVLYSSYFGNTKLLADQIAERTGAELQGIVHGRHFRCFLHLIGIRGGPYPLLDLSEYDLIYAGGPIWMGTAAPGFNRLLKNLDLSGKPIKFFFRAGGGNASRLDKKLSQKAAELKFEIVQTVVINGNDSTDVIDEKIKALIEGREPIVDT